MKIKSVDGRPGRERRALAWSRREFLRRAGGAAGAAAFAGGLPALLEACGGAGGGGGQAAKDVNIALVVPISGPYAEHGKLMQQGAQLAIDDINSQGGVKALGGAKLKLMVTDAGGTVETVTSATTRVLNASNVSAADGCWLSSFTLAATEIAERQRIPWLTFSFADNITTRGYKYVFRLDAPAGKQVDAALPALAEAARGQQRQIQTAALVGDNTASSVSLFKNLRDKLPSLGARVVLDRIWTPPLADPTQLALQVKQANPDIVFASPTTFDDTVGVQRALSSVGVKKPVLGNGAQFLTQQLLDALGAQPLEGLAAIAGSAVMKGMEGLSDRFQKRFKTFMIQDSTSLYAEMWTFKEAMERAKSSDPVKIRDAMSALDITSGPASQVPGGGVKFDEKGDNVKASVAIVQWQDGKPVTVAPVNQAVGKLRWPG